MTLNKHARQLLNTSDIDQVVILQQLQKDRLNKIEDIERSLRVDDVQGYSEGAQLLSSMNSKFENPYGNNPRSKRERFIGSKSEFISDNKRFNNSLDSRRSNHSKLNLRFEPKNIGGSRHLDDPFIYGLGL